MILIIVSGMATGNGDGGGDGDGNGASSTLYLGDGKVRFAPHACDHDDQFAESTAVAGHQHQSPTLPPAVAAAAPALKLLAEEEEERVPEVSTLTSTQRYISSLPFHQ